MSKELLEACVYNDIKLIEELLKKPFDIYYKNKNNQTCLHWACYSNNIELVKFLLNNGAKDIINDIDVYSRSCLYWACCNNNINLTKLLLESGSTTINVLNCNNITCLYYACFYNNIELVRLLLENRTNIDDETKKEYYNFLLEARL